jgi:GNAT superfamily N-acetyltransferase
MIDIQPSRQTDADYAASVAIHNAIWPCQLTTVEEVEHWGRTRDPAWGLSQDVPSPEPFTRSPFDVFVERTLTAPNFLPDAQIIAVDAGRWVGMSGLWKSLATPKRLHTGFTGVARSHRRKGVATAMKVEGIRFARAYGAEIIGTDNEENNPMYLLNLQLGFEPRLAELFYRKQMQVE